MWGIGVGVGLSVGGLGLADCERLLRPYEQACVSTWDHRYMHSIHVLTRMSHTFIAGVVSPRIDGAVSPRIGGTVLSYLQVCNTKQKEALVY